MAEQKQPFPGFIGPFNSLRATRFDNQRTVNMYLEIDPLPTGKESEMAVLIGTPGLKTFSNIGTGPIRALYTPSNQPNLLIIVSGSQVYTLTGILANPTITLIGTLNTVNGYISIADNGIQTFIVDGAYGYYITTSSISAATSVTQVNDSNFYPSSNVSFQDGYFIFNRIGTEYFFISNLYDITFPALNLANKSGFGDNIIAAISNNRELYLFGQQTIEIWWNSGNSAVTPFQRQDGKFINFGCASAATVKKLDNTLFWLGSDTSGGRVYMMQGDQAVRISTHAIESLIAQAPDISNSVAYAYQEEGHFFYVLNIVGLNTTLVFDTATGTWHERQSLNKLTNMQDRHWGNTHIFYNKTHLLGDFNTNALYKSNLDYYDDNGTPQLRLRQSPHISKDLNRIFYKLLEIDFQFGVGINGQTYIPGDGTDPKVILQISNDGGQSWGNEIYASLGKIGEYKRRARWQRLGSSRDRMFRVMITDPVKVIMLSAKLDLEIGLA